MSFPAARDLRTLSAKFLADDNLKWRDNPNKIPTYLADHIAIWKGNITEIDIDAIVNAVEENFVTIQEPQIDIHKAAGPELLKNNKEVLEEKRDLGVAFITPGYKLPAKYIIHTIGPGEKYNKDYEAPLTACYKNCMDALVGKNLTSIAFPAITIGNRVSDKKEAAGVALGAIQSWMLGNLDKIQNLLVVFCVIDNNDIIYGRLSTDFFPVLPFKRPWGAKDKEDAPYENIFNALETVYFLTGGSIADFGKANPSYSEDGGTNYTDLVGIYELDRKQGKGHGVTFYISACFTREPHRYSFPKYILERSMQDEKWSLAAQVFYGVRVGLFQSEEKTPGVREVVASFFLFFIDFYATKRRSGAPEVYITGSESYEFSDRLGTESKHNFNIVPITDWETGDAKSKVLVFTINEKKYSNISEWSPREQARLKGTKIS